MSPIDSEEDETEDETATAAASEPEGEAHENEELLTQARERFKQARESVKDDFEMAAKCQDFVAGNQWPENIKNDRLTMDRPCLTLDHLGQYCRHVINSSLMRKVDPRVLSMDGDGDDRVADILAGMIRQITQTSTSRVAYETGLRHAVHVGFGYWRVKVMMIPGTEQLEITIRRIADPRMVLFDPFCDYPDGRDANYCFVLTKLVKKEYEDSYGDSSGVTSWTSFESSGSVWPHIGAEGKDIVVAEYYYRDEDGTVKWCILTPDKILAQDVHMGNVIPILRVVGEEYEIEGKTRRRGMIEPAMDAARAYNYSASAFIENVALAPIAPFVATAGQVEQYKTEWQDSHRVPRAVLRYDPVSVGGQMAPPPIRSQPAGIPAGWDGMMKNLISDMQMIMGLGQPSVLGTGGGASMQSGAGVAQQQAPGEINTYHFHEHWMCAIEQTGRVILAMIPFVYTLPQAVKIVGDDGALSTVVLDPTQEQAVVNEEPAAPPQQPGMPPTGPDPAAVAQSLDAYGKVLSPTYNPNIGRYDVQIIVGPSSATKKADANKMLMTMINANPALMSVMGDLVIQTMDIPNADVIAKRMKTAGDPEQQAAQMKMHEAVIQKQSKEIQDLTQMVLAEQQKAIASMKETELNNQTAIAKAQLDAEVQLEIAVRGNINALLLEKMKSDAKISTTIIKALADADKEMNREKRMSQYSEVSSQLAS